MRQIGPNHKFLRAAAFIFLFGALLVSAGCKERNWRAGSAAHGASDIRLTVEGKRRHYRLYVPPSLDKSEAAPLIVAIHGGGSKPESFAKITRLDRLAGVQKGYVVAYPAGYQKFWHSGDDCCGPPYEEGIDDVAFIRAVLDDVKKRVRIDESRVYMTGFSNGGKMTYRVACSLASELAAIAVNGSSLGVSDCNPARPLPVLHFHGTADTFHPYEGGRGTATRFQMPQTGAPKTMKRWRRWNGCSDTKRVTYSKGAVRCETYTQCENNATITLCTIKGMGHQWPGFHIRRPRQLAAKLGPSTDDIDATGMMLRFFSRHSARPEQR